MILLGWEGFTNDGEALQYDAALAREWLTNADYRDFQDAVQRAASVVNRKVREKTEQAAKN